MGPTCSLIGQLIQCARATSDVAPGGTRQAGEPRLIYTGRPAAAAASPWDFGTDVSFCRSTAVGGRPRQANGEKFIVRRLQDV